MGVGEWPVVRFGRVDRGDAHSCAGCTDLVYESVRYLLRRSRLCPELIGFAGDRVWVPEMRGRGALWVVRCGWCYGVLR